MAGRPRAFDPDDVLDRALGVFWQNGFAGTGIADLEAATGLGRQSLYGAFGDKRALFERIVERYVQNVLEPGMRDVLDAPGSARANLERMFQIWEQVASSGEFNGCLVGNCIAEMSAREPELTELLGPKLELMESWYRRALERAQRAGEVSPKLDTAAVARAILAMQQGIAVVARGHRDAGFVRGVVQTAQRLLDA